MKTNDTIPLAPDLDQMLLSFTQNQLEELAIILTNLLPMSAKEIEKRFQFAYILEGLNKGISDIKPLLPSRSPQHNKKSSYEHKVKLVVDEYMAAKGVPVDTQTKTQFPYAYKYILQDSIIDSCPVEVPLKKYIFRRETDTTKKQTDSTFEKPIKRPEQIRFGFVTIVNRMYNFKIPSYGKISSELNMLAVLGCIRIVDDNAMAKYKTRSATLWGLSLEWYQKWKEGRKELMQEQKEEKIPDPLRLNFYLVPTKDNVSIYLKNADRVRQFI